MASIGIKDTANCDVAIVGAGISGLVAGYYLKEAGRKVRIFESKLSPGGAIQTVYKDGFLLECGPNTVLFEAALRELVSKLQIDNSLVKANKSAKKRYLALDKQNGVELVPVSSSPLKLLTCGALSFSGLLRAGLEVFLPRTKKEDESVASFFTRRFGEEVTQNLVAATMSGIWAGDIDTLSARSTVAKLWQAEKEHRSVILHQLTKRSKRGARAEAISFQAGLQTLVDSLARSFTDSELLTSAECTSMEREEESLRVKLLLEQKDYSVRAKHVILTSSAKSSAKILNNIAPELSERIREIPYASLRIMHISYEETAFSNPPNGFGFLIPPKYGLPLMGCIFSSSLFPHVAPEGKVLLTAFVRQESFCSQDNNPGQLPLECQQALELLHKLLFARKDPTLLQQITWPEAIPNYPLNHYQTVEQVARLPNDISILSNWQTTVSVPGLIKLAKEKAALI